jgi:hypothetical protein
MTTTPAVPALKKLLYLELPRSPNGHFKPILGPGGGFASETAIPQRTQVPGLGVTAMQRPWPLAKAIGFILVRESLAGIIPVHGD